MAYQKTEWIPDETVVSAENLNKIEDELERLSPLKEEVDSLKSSVSNGKAKIATAITDKGVVTNPDDTFDTMANNIVNIKTGKYGNATENDIIEGKTIGTENGLVTGTMPNRGIFNLGLGVTVPSGYYSGGSVPNGKKIQEGTVMPVTTQIQFRDIANNMAFTNLYYAQASLNLSFEPFGIIWYESEINNYFQGSFFKNSGVVEGDTSQYLNSNVCFTYGSGLSKIIAPKYSYDTTGLYLNTKGFCIPLAAYSNKQLRYIIFGK